MQHMFVPKYGPAENMQMTQSSVPYPGAGQVLIRVAASGVNRADILQRQGKYAPPAGTSDILGLEVSGEIIALGSDVVTHKIGDFVCALLSGGGYAEYVVADSVLCLPIPDGVSLVDAAGLPEVVFTAYSNMVMAGRLQVGESVLIHSGASGVGTMAIQLAHAMGARVFATVGNMEKQVFCEYLGAEKTINYSQVDFLPAMREITDGIDVVLDMLGGTATEKNIDLLKTNGRLVVIACPDGAHARINLVKMMQKRLTLHGSTLRSRPLTEKAKIAAEITTKVWPLFASGKIRPVTYQTLKLSEAIIAHRILESRAHIGKVVLTEG